MESIYLKNNEGIPQYGCSACYKCNSIFGKSLCEAKNRGCCWYYPKFTLYEIHKMIKSEEGLDNLHKILNLPNTDVYHYYIHCKGFFDKESYDLYVNSNGTSSLKFATDNEVREVTECILKEEEDLFIYEAYEEHDMQEIKHVKKPRVIKDFSMFFRACPFIETGKGCTLDIKYRSFICNFFICDEITEQLEDDKEFKRYIDERNNYVRWIEWENNSLEGILRERKINLVSNLNEVIDLLKKIEVNEYDFPTLKEVQFQL